MSSLTYAIFPWRDELVDLTGTQETHTSKFCQPEVQARPKLEPDAEAVAEALEFLNSNDFGGLHSSHSPNDQQNEDNYGLNGMIVRHLMNHLIKTSCTNG